MCGRADAGRDVCRRGEDAGPRHVGAFGRVVPYRRESAGEDVGEGFGAGSESLSALALRGRAGVRRRERADPVLGQGGRAGVSRERDEAYDGLHKLKGLFLQPFFVDNVI